MRGRSGSSDLGCTPGGPWLQAILAKVATVVPAALSLPRQLAPALESLRGRFIAAPVLL